MVSCVCGNCVFIELILIWFKWRIHRASVSKYKAYLFWWEGESYKTITWPYDNLLTHQPKHPTQFKHKGAVKFWFFHKKFRSVGHLGFEPFVNKRRRKKHFTIRLCLDPQQIDWKVGQIEAKIQEKWPLF